MTALPVAESESLRRLDAYVGLFRDAFRRRDQARWAFVYLQGLLLPGERKNVESLAGRVALPPDLAVSDVTQALQNFVNQSPWDEQLLWRRFRDVVGRPRLSPESVLVVEDFVFPKQGQHSVGVQRQHGGALGKKLNCQVAVGVHLAGPAGYCPLALRLYLPRGWCEAPERLDAVGVPEEGRTFLSRGQLALTLADALRAEGFAVRGVLLGQGYHASDELKQGLRQRGLAETTANGSDGEAFLGQVKEGCRQLHEELGLGHFEGRSWRGFHHHTCLVMLAFGFRLWERGA